MITGFEAVSTLEGIARTDLSDPQAVRLGAQAMELCLLSREPSAYAGLLEALGEANVSTLQELYERFETDLEYEFASKVLAGEASVENYPLYDRFVRLIAAEAELAGIRPEDTLNNSIKKWSFIGSGPFPISAILFAKMTGVSVGCFDVSAKAIETSTQVIEKLGLSDKIRFINAAGEHGDIAEYDAVVVALLAQPKDEIAWNIRCHCPIGTQVIMRYSEGNRVGIYKGMDQRVEGTIWRYSLTGVPCQRSHHAGVDDTISSKLWQVASSIEKY